jgi:hypothetical protein
LKKRAQIDPIKTQKNSESFKYVRLWRLPQVSYTNLKNSPKPKEKIPRILLKQLQWWMTWKTWRKDWTEYEFKNGYSYSAISK